MQRTLSCYFFDRTSWLIRSFGSGQTVLSLWHHGCVITLTNLSYCLQTKPSWLTTLRQTYKMNFKFLVWINRTFSVMSFPVSQDSTVVARLCGNRYPGQYYYSSGPYMLVSFISDESISSQGFELQYTAVDPNDEQTIGLLPLCTIFLAPRYLSLCQYLCLFQSEE